MLSWRCPLLSRRHARSGKAHHRLFGGVLAPDNPGLPSFAHHQYTIGEQQEFRHFGRHNDDAESLRREIKDQPVDFLLGADIDAAGRLVERRTRGSVASHLPITTFC